MNSSKSGMIAEWVVNDKGRLYHAYDNLQSRWYKKEVNHCKRYEMKKTGRRFQ
jgi:hypothetical protein